MTRNRFLLGIALALLVFQILFSVYYSTQIIDANLRYSSLQKKYNDLNVDNQQLEVQYTQKFSISEQTAF
jgi:hypothetical protein